MGAPTSPSRRERLRTATIAEIKDVARRLLVEGGPSAISLRAIARDMGMTAPAIYRYYAGLDELVGDLRNDLFDELRQVTERARAEVRDEAPMARLNEMARTFRRWALEHKEEFGLMLGPPIPGVSERRDRGEPDYAIANFGTAFLNEFAEMWKRGTLSTPPPELLQERLGPHLGAFIADLGDALPLPVVFVFLTAWTRLYGIVAMEVFSHMEWAVTDVEALFETELVNFARQLVRSGGEDTPAE